MKRSKSPSKLAREIRDLRGGDLDYDRTESWARYIELDLDPNDPYHRQWISLDWEGASEREIREYIKHLNESEDYKRAREEINSRDAQRKLADEEQEELVE